MVDEIFKVGCPIPKVWLHMELDLQDTLKYLNEAIIETEEERNRLIDKYLSGNNSTNI